MQTSDPPAVEALLSGPAAVRPRGTERSVPARGRLRPVSFGLATAALLFVGVALGALWSKVLSPARAFGAAEFSTAAWEMATVRLGDGTIVRLAPETRLRIQGSGSQREVRLDGQAFFAVAEQPGTPFVVRTRLGEALVLGTRFDLRVEDNSLRVVVVDGRVALSAGGRQVPVEGGQVGMALNGGWPTVTPVDDVHSLIEWMDQSLIFQATPLHQVAAEMERRYGVEVEIVDSALAERTVTAWFTSQNLQEMTAVVCRVTGARCSIDGAKVVIAP